MTPLNIYLDHASGRRPSAVREWQCDPRTCDGEHLSGDMLWKNWRDPRPVVFYD